jgi:invasion protein IalB
MNTKLLNWNVILLFAAVFFFTACDKEATEELTTTNLTLEERADPYEGTRGQGGLLPRGCFEFVFPVTVIYPDGGSDEATDAQSIRQLFRAWCQENPGTERPGIEMPFDVVIEDEEVVTISAVEDFQAIVADCLPDGPPRPGHRRLCFRPVFPVTLAFPDGTTEEVENRFQLKMAIRAWKEANPNSDERPAIQFPYDVTLQDGTVLTVNNQEDVQAILEDCQPDGNYGPCFRPVYPLTMVFPDGTTEEVDDRAALRMAIRAWKEANPNSDERPAIQFPYDVTLQDGTVVTVESADDVEALLEECGYDGRERLCFRPVFPLTIAFPDGNNATVENRFEFRMSIRVWVLENQDAEERPSIAFPYDVMLRDGTVLTIEDEDQLADLIASCAD